MDKFNEDDWDEKLDHEKERKKVCSYCRGSGAERDGGIWWPCPDCGGTGVNEEGEK